MTQSWQEGIACANHAGFKSNGSKPSSESFWGIPEQMCQNILRNEWVKSANTNVIIALASTVSIIKTTIAKYSNKNSKLGLPTLSCQNVQKRPLFAEFSLLAEERVFSWGIAHAACIFEPLSQQHPCLSMNSVRRRVNLGHCCLPGKRVFSMRQCAIMFNG